MPNSNPASNGLINDPRNSVFVMGKSLKIAVNPDLFEYIKSNMQHFVAFKDQIEFIPNADIKHDLFKIFLQPGNSDITSRYL